MERRKFLIGAGSAAVGSSALIGSGAFTRVQADRSVTIAVADDSDALLSFSPSSGPNGAYAEERNGKLHIDTSLVSDAEGVNQDAHTRFRNVFEVQNNGTQSVVLYFQVEDQPMGFYSDSTPYSETEGVFNNGLGDNNSGAAPEKPPVNKPVRHLLEPGDTMKEIGFGVDPRDFETANEDATFTFTWVARDIDQYPDFDASSDDSDVYSNPEHN